MKKDVVSYASTEKAKKLSVNDCIVLVGSSYYYIDEVNKKGWVKIDGTDITLVDDGSSTIKFITSNNRCNIVKNHSCTKRYNKKYIEKQLIHHLNNHLDMFHYNSEIETFDEWANKCLKYGFYHSPKGQKYVEKIFKSIGETVSICD